MTKIYLNDDYAINLETLIDTRLLIQGGSGSGKSWLIRRILEQSHGKVQHIIFDLEGEFATLREKYDYLLAAAKDGDVVAHPRSAAILARKTLEHGFSLIIDLSELQLHERSPFVKNFLEAMIHAPKNLRHPCLVVIDEAHHFVPQIGDNEAKSAVIDLCTRGRKRGFCAILATQRISKLHKDAAAECNNKLIGRTGLDIDMKRAYDELGFNSKEQFQSLKHLKPGEFFAYGAALTEEVQTVAVGKIETTHPKVGSRSLTKVIPPTKLIKELLGKLTDLPKEAETEAKTVEELKAKVSQLTRELRVAPRPAQVWADPKAIERAVATALEKRDVEWKKYAARLMEMAKRMVASLKKEVNAWDGAFDVPPAPSDLPKFSVSIPSKITPKFIEKTISTVVNGDKPDSLGRCAEMIYSFLVKNHDRSFNKRQVGAATGYSIRSSGFENAVSKLHTMGLIKKSGEELKAAVIDESLAKYINHDFSIKVWLNNLGKCPREIFEVLLNNPGVAFQKEDLAARTPSKYSVTSSGFENAISSLNSTGLIRKQGNYIELNVELLEI